MTLEPAGAPSPFRSLGSRILRAAAGGAAGLALYLAMGTLLHRVVLPLPPPDPDIFPRVGDVLASRVEGFSQRVLAVEDGWIHSELTLSPGAAGPPPHYHLGFAETFRVIRGELHLDVGGETRILGPGDQYRVEPGVIHRPHNPTGEPVVVGGGPVMPLTFAACLVQVYSFMEEYGDGPGMLLELSVAGDHCDTHLPMPRLAEAALYATVAPAARLLGHRGYYPELSLHPPGA